MRLSPFFIRASGGHIRRRDMRQEHSSQSLLHQGIGRTRRPSLLTMVPKSQSLLHQGIGRTWVFGLLVHNQWSQSLLHQGIGRTNLRIWETQMSLVSVPSSSGHRADLADDQHQLRYIRLSPFFIRASGGPFRKTAATQQLASQSLLHQGIGRTWNTWPIAKHAVSQSLLHQGIGRTAISLTISRLGLVSVPSSSGHRADLLLNFTFILG